MANYLSVSRSEYVRSFDRFRGVDLSSEEELVRDGRFCHLRNMWRDYASGQGDAIETFPGFRCLHRFEGKINGIFHYRTRAGLDFVVVHAGEKLHRFRHASRDSIGEHVESFGKLADARSTAFMFADKLYLLDGTTYWRLDEEGLRAVVDVAYEPTSFVEGEEYEQVNMLGGRTRETHNAGTEQSVVVHGLYYADYGQLRVPASSSSPPTSCPEWYLRNVAAQAVIYTSYERIFAAWMASSKTEEIVFKSSAASTRYISLDIRDDFLVGCPNLKKLYFPNFESRYQFETEMRDDVKRNFDESLLPAGCQVFWGQEPDVSEHYSPIMTMENQEFVSTACLVTPNDRATKIVRVQVDEEDVVFNPIMDEDEKGRYVKGIILDPAYAGKQVSMVLQRDTREFKSVGEHLDFYTGNPEYKGTAADAINRCTVVCHFDGRLFFTGNPTLPNTIFYTQRDLTGYNNPTYIGILNYMNDGVGNTPNTAMAVAQGTLMVFKADTAQDGSVYYHSGQDTGEDLIPRIYPSTAGVPGVGCLGAAVNFYDDVCFLSRRGLEAIGKQTVNLERTVEHRSSNVDRALSAEELSTAHVAEWCGYLVILCGERAYLADSRQIFTHATGVAQYEWYLLDDLCTYRETRPCYRGTEVLPMIEVDGEEASLGQFQSGDKTHLLPIGNGEDIDRAKETIMDGDFEYKGHRMTLHYVVRDGKAYYIEPTGEVQGVGEAAPASAVASIGDVLYFGTEDGSLCCINTDKRGESYDHGDGNCAEVESDGIYRLYYTHDGRRYVSGFATPMDNCNYPHMLKTTVKKSCVLKMKTLSGGGFRVQSRTDRTSWRQVQRTGGTIEQVIACGNGGFDDFDFGAVNYNGDGAITVPIMEKEKKWVEKQLYLYSDGYAQPFGIFGLTYRFFLAGRIKK